MKATLVLLFIALCCSGLKTLSAEDIEEPLKNENSLPVAGRSWISGSIIPAGLVRKVFEVDPLQCEGLSCSSCLTLLNKQACFDFTYNGEEGEKGKLDLEFEIDGKRVMGTSLHVGQKLPTCHQLPPPLRRVCVDEFSAELGKGGTLSSSICFRLTFVDHGFASRFCIGFADGHFQASVQPEIFTSES